MKEALSLSTSKSSHAYQIRTGEVGVALSSLFRVPLPSTRPSDLTVILVDGRDRWDPYGLQRLLSIAHSINTLKASSILSEQRWASNQTTLVFKD